MSSCWDASKDPKPETLKPNGFGIQRVSGLPEKPEKHGSAYMGITNLGMTLKALNRVGEGGEWVSWSKGLRL